MNKYLTELADIVSEALDLAVAETKGATRRHFEALIEQVEQLQEAMEEDEEDYSEVDFDA